MLLALVNVHGKSSCSVLSWCEKNEGCLCVSFGNKEGEISWPRESETNHVLLLPVQQKHITAEMIVVNAYAAVTASVMNIHYGMEKA
jgi:hypothetical protein